MIPSRLSTWLYEQKKEVNVSFLSLWLFHTLPHDRPFSVLIGVSSSSLTTQVAGKLENTRLSVRRFECCCESTSSWYCDCEQIVDISDLLLFLLLWANKPSFLKILLRSNNIKYMKALYYYDILLKYKHTYKFFGPFHAENKLNIETNFSLLFTKKMSHFLPRIMVGN